MAILRENVKNFIEFVQKKKYFIQEWNIFFD